MPKLWSETIEVHRREVHDTILETTAALVFRDGLRAVTMSQIAAEAGIGRATLYKYFADVDAILHTWHAGHVSAQLDHLRAVRDGADDGDRLEAVLRAYVLISRHARSQHAGEVMSALAGGEEPARAHRQLHDLVRRLIAEAAEAGLVRGDVAPAELASYCVHALDAAREARSRAAADRLVDITLTALQPPT